MEESGQILYLKKKIIPIPISKKLLLINNNLWIESQKNPPPGKF